MDESKNSLKRKRRKDSEKLDEIIDEIPVFISRGIGNNLCIFQYPTKPISFVDNDIYVSNCKVKPESKEVKFDVGIDTESIHYDTHKADRLTRLGTEGKGANKAEKPVAKKNPIESIPYTGTSINLDMNKFVVCLYQDKEVHMCPINSIIQMRPTMTHFDKEDKRRKAEEKAQSDGEQDEVKAVTVKFASAQDKMRNKLNFLKNDSDEQWMDGKWHNPDSIESGVERQRMFTTNQALCSTVPESEIMYSSKILPSDGGLQGVEALLPPREFSKQRTKPLPMVDQVKTVLKNAKIITFSNIVKWLTQINEEVVDKEKVLRNLGQVGLIFHGNWVPKSEVLYPSESVSSINGVNSDLMVRARDYVIFKLSRQPFLYRTQVMLTTQLPPEETLEILESCAKLSDDKKWIPALPNDVDFEEQHKDLILRQEMYWTALEHFFQELENEKPFKRVRQRSQRSERSD